MIVSLAPLASRCVPRAYGRRLAFQEPLRRHRIGAALTHGAVPALIEDRFEELEARSFPLAAGTYRYDRFSCVVCSAERLARLAKILAVLDSPKRILEVSCGDGWTGSLLALGGHQVALSDVKNWRHERCREVPFLEWDVCSGAPPQVAPFDLIVAYNATEHWSDPAAALQSLLALLNVGGQLLLDFGPLFNSPWGLHAWSVRIPYPQFLFSKPFIERKVAELGVDDLGQHTSTLQPTNGWTLEQFRTLWKACGAEMVSNLEDHDFRYLALIEEFPSCFQGRGLNFYEITVNSIEVLLRRVC